MRLVGVGLPLLTPDDNFDVATLTDVVVSARTTGGCAYVDYVFGGPGYVEPGGQIDVFEEDGYDAISYVWVFTCQKWEARLFLR